MLTLLSECHFWTIRDDVRIKPNDFGAFRYMRNRELHQQQQLIYQQHLPQQHQNQQYQQTHDVMIMAKRDYTERRNGLTTLKNSSRKAMGRLKDNLKKLEELLRTHKIVHSQWQDATQVLLLFTNGIIVHICVDIYTGDILRMVFEKYLVGKLASEQITSAFFTRSHIVLAYNTNQLTVVHLQKPNVRVQGPEKICNMEARIFHIIIPGPAERKLTRHLVVNDSYDLFVVWTKSSQNEVYPWRPTIRDQDRANIHVFKLKGIQMDPLSYCWSENDPLCVDFLRSSESQILTLEQKVSRKGEITAEICSYALTTNTKMQRTTLTSIAMGTQICCFAFSPDQEKLFLGSIDRNICLHDLVRQTSKFIKQIEIIPTHCTWHCDSSIIMIANDRSQFQCFDLALTPIANQLQSEDVTPSNLLDVSHYFTQQPTLLQIAFSKKPDFIKFAQNYAQTDCFLLLLFENGPLGCLRFFAGAGMRGDIHNSGLTADVIVDRYLSINQLEKAVNLLLALNWETYGAMCLISLHKIAKHVFFRGEARQTRIELMAKALKTFAVSLSEETKDEFSDQVFDLKRRFFFFLLRKNLYVEAFEVAQDIEDYDLFMDLHNITKSHANLIEFSAAAFSQAANILHEEDRANGNLSLIVGESYRSESACSQSSCSDTLLSTPNSSQLTTSSTLQKPLKAYVPAALPSLKSKIYNAEMIKINTPKSELRADETNFNQPEIKRTPPPLPPTSTHSLKMVLPAVNNTLANLSIRSQQQARVLNGGQNLRVWQQTNEQSTTLTSLLNAPTSPYVPSTAHNILPRASTVAATPITVDSGNNLTSTNTTQMYQKQQQQHQIKNTTPYMHYGTTPALIAEHQLVPPSRHYQQPAVTASTTPALSTLYQPKFYQHPLVLGNIPPTATVVVAQDDIHHHNHHQKRQLMKKPTASILSNAGHNNVSTTATPTTTTTSSNAMSSINGNKELVATEKSNKTTGNGEKNKVKFSDTIQVAVVPGKPIPPKRNGYSRPSSTRNLMNPKKELADSLPLCHPHDDYLKDFNPISTENQLHRPHSKSTTKDESTSKSVPPSIKVVHFGVV